MARANKCVSVSYTIKKDYTFGTTLVSNKSIMIVDPDKLADGEEWIDNPPTKGYDEIWSRRDHVIYDVYKCSIDELATHLTNKTLSDDIKLGSVVIDSGYQAVCNSRYKLLDKSYSKDIAIINEWTGKVYNRSFDVIVTKGTNKVNVSFVGFEGIKSGRKSFNFIMWPRGFEDEILKYFDTV